MTALLEVICETLGPSYSTWTVDRILALVVEPLRAELAELRPVARLALLFREADTLDEDRALYDALCAEVDALDRALRARLLEES